MTISTIHDKSKNVLRKLRLFPDDGKYTLFTSRDILHLVIPLFFEQLLFMLVGSADTLMVASLGEASISAVSLVDMFNNCVGSILFALATGGAVVVSQYLGAGNLIRARESAKQLLAVTLTAGMTVLVVLELFLADVIRLLYGELPPDVHPLVLSYFRITLTSIPIIAVYGGCSALLRSMRRTRTTMYISLVSNLINLAGNAILIYIFHLGVAGAAYATVFSRLVAMLIIIFMVMDKSKPVYIDFKKGFRISWYFVRRILFIGIPGGIENGVFQFGRVLVLGLIASYGTREIAANAVANVVDYFGCVCAHSFCLAVVTVIGQAVGAGDEQQIRYYVRKMLKWTYTTHIIWNIMLLALTPLILSCFSKIDAETRQLALYLILIHNVLGMVMWPGSFVFPCILRSMNDVRFTMILSIGSMFLVRVGSSYLIANWINSGVIAVWIAMIFDWLVRFGGFYWRYRSGVWTKLAGLKRIAPATGK